MRQVVDQLPVLGLRMVVGWLFVVAFAVVYCGLGAWGVRRMGALAGSVVVLVAWATSLAPATPRPP